MRYEYRYGDMIYVQQANRAVFFLGGYSYIDYFGKIITEDTKRSAYAALYKKLNSKGIAVEPCLEEDPDFDDLDQAEEGGDLLKDFLPLFSDQE